MAPDDTRDRRRATEQIERRLTVLERDSAFFREILIGNPTPEDLAQGRQLGVIGMLARGQRERKLILILLTVVSSNNLIDLIGRVGPILKGIRGLLP